MHRYRVTFDDGTEERFAEYAADDLGHAFEQATQDCEEGERITEVSDVGEFGFWIHKHEVSQTFGGPEEGGWYFEVGVPVPDWTPPKFEVESAANESCRSLNAEELERRKREETYDYTSVLSHESVFYAYSVEETPIMSPYPERRPHYE